MNTPPVIVVGAGLAGLSCASALHRAGCRVHVVEAADSVGGRVRTDSVRGFTIDRGFQVLNTAYPALRRGISLDGLELRPLPRGVRVRRDGRLHTLQHPLAGLAAVPGAARSELIGVRSKLALARYAGNLVRRSPEQIIQRVDLPCSQAWQSELGEEVARSVLVPFFSGVLLESDPVASRVFTDLMMRMFLLGVSAVPARGMQALPDALRAQVPPDAVSLESAVTSVSRSTVTLQDSTRLSASAVVVATDPWTAHDLLPGLGNPPPARAVTSYYFAAASWPSMDPFLTVDADGSGVVNSVVLSASAPEYSPDGRALVATSVLHGSSGPLLSADQACEVARALHGADAGEWELIATRDVPRALPAMLAPHPLRRPNHLAELGIWVAGDHRDTSSIQGALVSGRRTARDLLRRQSGGGSDA